MSTWVPAALDWRVEFAHRADLGRTYISSLECSIYSPSIEVLDRLSTALGVEAAALLKKSQ
ncbi:helix-turn-helix domain-containing protein [Rhizobium giardinii]|uniref:helix-turn-helix domain-containing protein n=1 Tax=Rhizobium giardinii TaxID=56731 RepID=UPI000A0270AE|nr:helix-turn-helix transcriptional regulator [Rhizobium giardinii]